MKTSHLLLRGVPLLLVMFALTNAACRSQARNVDPGVRSHLEGSVTVSPEVDSTADFRGFEVIVGARGEGGLDTLAFATTDASGRFAADVAAPRRGLYPLIIAREGTILRTGQLIIADGDSASFSIQLPSNQPLRIRSNENSAWAAFENTRALHNQSLIQLISEGDAGDEVLERQVMQASSILWDLRNIYPETVGADLAAAEAITLLEGWNDSLLVARAEEIDEENPAYVDVVRAVRRAEARLHGQQAAVNKMLEFQLRTNDRDRHAAIQTEVVIAYMDSLDERNARLAAQNLQQSYPRTAWAEWATRVMYEIENLLPGKPAPEFSLADVDGRPLQLQDLRGRIVLLEFYVPESGEFLRQLPLRQAMVTSAGDQLEVVTLSLQPDSVVVEALFEDREIAGRHVILEEGEDAAVVRDYNITAVPTRFLIDPEGRIIGRYVGENLYPLQMELAERTGSPTSDETSEQ